MSKRISSIVAVAALALAATETTEAFAPTAFVPTKTSSFTSLTPRFAEETKESDASDAAFVPSEPAEEGDDDTLAAVESLGRGAAKAKRGKRKGGSSAPSPTKAATNLAPEEVYYEGPPAITETIVPTISILTVVGIIPAAAAWARQAWVRYKITSRRIRVTSGIGGKDMAEIVYPDIVEIRTAKRLFGDGDMVAFLRDGAKFEMRNIPEFEETMEFILKQVAPEVAKKYREKGDVTQG
mmetsp:Transcript_2419/g.6951  ORF Transcript_2419/g.6951 Transcript_2419/m.6951 type:complete len:239 (-) Transcript_2419:162-878(-)